MPRERLHRVCEIRAVKDERLAVYVIAPGQIGVVKNLKFATLIVPEGYQIRQAPIPSIPVGAGGEILVQSYRIKGDRAIAKAKVEKHLIQFGTLPTESGDIGI